MCNTHFQADQEMKIEQDRRVQEGAKLKMQEQLIHSVCV